ncbi:radical SAM/SPASM family putative metalloenzyme maturase [Geobacter argillaceus]|nr:radical SAM/SPASM family putative metalloenzyme maturase [Geobacter argillaceus]
MDHMDVKHKALQEFPRKLFVEVTTRCNLSCFMCVKQNQEGLIEDGDLSPALFQRLEPLFPQLEALILNGIGEPLLHPHLEEFIRQAKAQMPANGWVGFQSNGLLMTNLRALSLVDAGLDRICLSIDALTPEKFRQMREGGEVEGVERAIAALNAAKKRCNRPEVRVGVEFVAMRGNLRELPATLRWAAQKGAAFAIVTHVLPYDADHVDETAFGSCTDKALALFQEWQERAGRENIDLGRYFEVRWRKYAREPGEQAVVEMVESMKREAQRQGIFLDLKKLLLVDFGMIEETAGVFDEVREVARETGLDVRLPEITLREQRSCSFVEDGSAFVSWQGDVSPCYFLWHRYQCYASGWHQSVKPKVFGNLADQGPLAIWNSPEFRTFRSSVLAYDYPSCVSCALAPCDYVQTEKFEQDCHIGNVPCGACLWCMGVFQCLR